LSRDSFQCQKCAKCCRNLFEKRGAILGGLPLTDREAILFPKDLVLPKISLGTTKPEHTIIYQLNVNSCPHLNNEQTCRIYPRRPLMCKAFPIVGEAISNKCTIFSYRKPGLVFDEPFSMDEQLAASIQFEEYLKMQLKKHGQKGFKLWEYDLDTKKWFLIT
jgi:Fe-S-cluster containining protein